MRAGMIDCQAIRDRWVTMGSKLDERGRRVFAAMEVRAVGRGGLEVVSQITGLARSTIGRGLKDLDTEAPPAGRVRREEVAGGICRIRTLHSSMTSGVLSSRPPGEILCDRCCGCRKATRSWRSLWRRWATRSAPTAYAGSCRRLGFAGRRTARPTRVHD